MSDKPHDAPSPGLATQVVRELTPEQIFIINDMIHAWIEEKGEYRQAFRNDCKRLLATALRMADVLERVAKQIRKDVAG